MLSNTIGLHVFGRLCSLSSDACSCIVHFGVRIAVRLLRVHIVVRVLIVFVFIFVVVISGFISVIITTFFFFAGIFILFVFAGILIEVEVVVLTIIFTTLVEIHRGIFQEISHLIIQVLYFGGIECGQVLRFWFKIIVIFIVVVLIDWAVTVK